MTTFLCPGQGAQTPGFMHELPDTPEVAATLAEASRALGHDVLDLDTAEHLESTVAVQLTALVAGVAMSRALITRDVRPDSVAGLSVGSFTAAVIAGALDFTDAVPLVRLRASLMEQAYPTGYGMAAFGGFNQRRLAQLAEAQATAEEPLYLANFNAPTEIVVTGAVAALERLVTSAQEAGARRAQRLAVSVPSHCPLLADVSTKLAAALESIPIQAPRLTYVGNRRARILRDAAAVVEELATNVCNPVLWHDSTTLLFELGERFFIEMPPGTTLTGLAGDAFPDADARCSSRTPLDTLVYLAARAAREG
ncbi:MAG: malonate decarboxylase subunit epsilon [Azospirillaceae bacterium]|nr:malonate decarboxylase subunit epsilon [Azospirillaceae bacterium]